jgi:hypothetical protein
MEFISSLWLPILASAAAVWIVSALLWMALGHHQKDTIALPNEDATLDQLRGIPPGNYSFPHPGDRKNCNSPEFKAKWEKGPMGNLSVWGKFSMGKNMALTFMVYVIVSVLIGYVAYLAIPPGADRLKVFQIIGTVGVLSYTFAFIPDHIWFQAGARKTTMCIIDGIVYGLVTGGVFAAFWKGATMAVPALPAIGS